MIKKSDLNKEIYKPKEIADMLGLALKSVQNYMSEGKIKAFTPGERNRRVKREDLISYLIEEDLLVEDEFRYDASYVRVSTQKQKNNGDLERQQTKINNLIISKSPKELKCFEDVSSGLNDNRKGLNSLLDEVMEDKVDRIFILYKDRLTRFGFNYIERVCRKHNTEIVVLSNEVKDKTREQELAEDIISIIHSFSGKLYGSRKKLQEEINKELKEE